MLLAFLDGVQMAALDAGVFKRFENCACCCLQFHGGILEKHSCTEEPALAFKAGCSGCEFQLK
jgi:hypothetical protein